LLLRLRQRHEVHRRVFERDEGFALRRLDRIVEAAGICESYQPRGGKALPKK